MYLLVMRVSHKISVFKSPFYFFQSSHLEDESSGKATCSTLSLHYDGFDSPTVCALACY